MACNVSQVNLCRVRGDTEDVVVNVKDANGAAIDITGFTYLLSTDPSPDPPDATTQVFQIIGSVTNGPAGEVTFPVTLTEADITPSVYFYDVQQTDTGGTILTILQGQWEVSQDITK